MVTFIKPSSLNLSDLIYTHFCFSSCYLELNQWLCYTESCTLSLYHPCISISGGNMLGCCLLSPFGFVAYNFSSSLVSITLRYGYYGDSCILLGPASSRLMKTSSVFVKQLQVSNKDNNQVILHAFNEKPELSSQTNWTVSNLCLVEAYKSKGISLWLNQGSTIRMGWEAHTTSSLDQLHGMVIKGEKKFKLPQAKQTSFPNAMALHKIVNGKEAEYKVEEDNMYHMGVLNMNARNIILNMKVNVSAKVYDTTKGKKMCSTANGSCRLSFVFPNTQYVIFTAPGKGDGGSYVEISFLARVLTYILLLGALMIVVYLILKFLGVYDGGDRNSRVTVDATYRTSDVVARQTETEPLMQVETNRWTYGTNAKDDEEEDSGASSSSSEELYDEKLCCICYDEQRNSFFVPCGHCATCYDCAERIVDGESKVCPICRRLIHKVRRLYHN
ncbi:Death-associated inhibitor of apoptosis 1 [Glycine max]|nr:Death-associated inhibitor of apoptosis 1 [Glycine max]